MSVVSFSRSSGRRRFVVWLGAIAFVLLVGVGIFAANDWFPRTDSLSGKRYGWFGKPLAKNAPSSWNLLPDPTPTPQLSKELIYAGSRLLTVEDKNATAAPPADLAVWRPSSGMWYVFGGSWITQSWGTSGDIPVPGDFDGDGKTDFSILRHGTGSCPCVATWYIIYSSTNTSTNFTYAVTDDLPAQADYDGDGKTDPAVFRPSDSTWYIQGSSIGYYTQNFGASGDIPAPADHDGDGKADLAVFRPTTTTFYSFATAIPGMNTVSSGISTSGSYTWCDECLVCGDYDGDGKDDYAVFDQLAANWYIKPSSGTMGSIVGTPSSTTSEGFGVFQWGASGDRPVQNYYDNDGKVDYSVWTPSGTDVGRWHIKKSTDGTTRNQVWGIAADIPVPALYRR